MADVSNGAIYRRSLHLARTTVSIHQAVAASYKKSVEDPIAAEIATYLSGLDRQDGDVTVVPDRVGARIMALANSGASVAWRGLSRDLRDLAGAEYEWQRSEIVRAKLVRAKIQATRGQVTKAVEKTMNLPALGAKVEKTFAKLLSDQAGQKVREKLQVGLSRGLSDAEILKTLRGTKALGFTDGLLPAVRVHQLKALVRTAANHVSSTSRVSSMRDLGVGYWMFVATLDTRTTTECVAHDNLIFEVGKGPLPPLHPGCRSTPKPVLSPEQDPVGTRSSRDGPVPAKTSARSWFDDLPEKEQNRMVGPTRAAALRKGDVTWNQLLGDDLEPLSIAELRRLGRIEADGADES